MSVRKTQEQVLAKFVAKHGDRYDYRQAVYVDSDTKMTVICREHGAFEITSGDHYSGKGCRKCGRKIVEQARRLPASEVADRVISAQGLKYIFHFDGYTSGSSIRYMCPVHGWREQAIRNVIKVGCSECQIERNAIRRTAPLTFNELQEYVECDLETGRLYEKKTYLKHRQGDEIPQHTDNRGYLQVMINRRHVPIHRVVLAFMLGEMPPKTTVCDHINGVVDDNRACNLRMVTQKDNCRNQSKSVKNKSTVTGVFYIEKEDVFLAYITYDGRRRHLGRYKTFEEAVARRKDAERFFEFHPNHGLSREDRAETT